MLTSVFFSGGDLVIYYFLYLPILNATQFKNFKLSVKHKVHNKQLTLTFTVD